MRIDNKDPSKKYKDFWDWLSNGHIIFLVSLAIGYFYYLISTTDINDYK